MGVIQKKLYVDGINLANYGLYITGQSVFNAPQRDVELVAIPGRNGDYIIDNGRFQNIEVTYPAGLREDVTNFATRVAEIRNILASRHRYVRIEDDYNPDEYREGMFVSGLEVTPACDNIAGQFDLVFNCKPQRFLKSGETAVSVASGGTITNPTAFESKPLIEFGGYGTMTVNGYAVTLNSEAIGLVTLRRAGTVMESLRQFSTARLNSPDHITLQASRIIEEIQTEKAIASATVSVSGGLFTGTAEVSYTEGANRIIVYFNAQPYDFIKSNDAEHPQTGNNVVTVNVTYSDSTTSTITLTYVITAIGTPIGQIEITRSFTTSGERVVLLDPLFEFGAVIGNSSQSVLGNPIYVDCELGDCYKYEDGEMVFLNSYVSMPNDLPVLSAGSNSVTYDNTITDFKIAPHWWRV